MFVAFAARGCWIERSGSTLAVHERYYLVVDPFRVGDAQELVVRSAAGCGHGLSAPGSQRYSYPHRSSDHAEVVTQSQAGGGDGAYGAEVEYAAQQRLLHNKGVYIFI